MIRRRCFSGVIDSPVITEITILYKSFLPIILLSLAFVISSPETLFPIRSRCSNQHWQKGFGVMLDTCLLHGSQLRLDNLEYMNIIGLGPK